MPAKRRSKPYIAGVPEGTEDGSDIPKDTEDGSDIPKDTEDGSDIPDTLPLPGVTDRKKEPLQAPKKSRPRKLLSPEELQEQETTLKDKYPQLIEGTLINATKGNPIEGLSADEITKFHHKRSCTIKCTCGLVRRIATSDLAQVKLCPNCTRNERNRRKRERRATAAKK